MTEKARIDEAALRRLVERFYARVRSDPMFGEVFEDVVHDWPDHLARLTDFWSSVMLTSGRYKGQPVPIHRALSDRITPAMFDRWLALWRITTEEMMTPDGAAALQAKAARIAESLRRAMFFRPGPEGRRQAIERPRKRDLSRLEDTGLK